jgi:hypothetical protein
MISRLLSTFAGLLIFQLPFATRALPQPPKLSQDQEMNFTLQGKITSITDSKFTVNSEENMLFHVRFDDKTEIKKADGSPGAGKDLRVGLKVDVAGDLAESGEITAKKIAIQSEEKEKK